MTHDEIQRCATCNGTLPEDVNDQHRIGGSWTDATVCERCAIAYDRATEHLGRLGFVEKRTATNGDAYISHAVGDCDDSLDAVLIEHIATTQNGSRAWSARVRFECPTCGDAMEIIVPTDGREIESATLDAERRAKRLADAINANPDRFRDFVEEMFANLSPADRDRIEKLAANIFDD